MHSLKSHFPRVGMRIVKSTAAVGVCMGIYYLLGKEEIPFFLVIAALQGLQQYQKDVREVAARNVFGTLLGAACALVVMVAQHYLLGVNHDDFIIHSIFITLGIGICLYSAVVTGHGDSAQFTAVVYLCIVSVHMEDQSSFMYVTQRLVETLGGIGVGMVINALRIPRRRVKDTLFVAALDDVLHSESSILPEYSKVELNRILDDGVRLSVITQHSTASFWEAAGSIRFKMPVILLDGAVLYDPAEKHYLEKVELSGAEAAAISGTVSVDGLSVYQSAVVDDSVLTFCRQISEDSMPIYEQMRRSNYRNFIHQPIPPQLPVVYVLCIGREEKLDEAMERLRSTGMDKKYKILRYRHEQEGMGYMRIYSAGADRGQMLEKLRQVCGLEKLRSFGNDPEKYDVCVRAAEGESILKALKKEAEPFFWKKKR